MRKATKTLSRSLAAAALCAALACDGDDGETTMASGASSESASSSAGSASDGSTGDEPTGGGACEVDPLEGQCEAYVNCMTTKCADAYEECYGDLLNSGAPGGVCGEWLECAAACDCDDDACKQACSMSQACTDCNTMVLGGCAASMCLSELAMCS